MRKFNMILSAVILVMFIIHAVIGSMQLIGANTPLIKTFSHIFEALVWIHVIIGIYYSIKTLVISKKNGVAYFKQNKLFWARRISGFAIMILLFFHFNAFTYVDDGVVRLQVFTILKLATQILLVLSVATHVISNVKPMLISLGIRSLKKRSVDILFILAILLLFMAIAFVVYYLRWNT